MNPTQLKFLSDATAQAVKANVAFPQMWASEAALESDFGNSVLAIQGKNLFGMKQKKHPVYGTLMLPTKEFENGEWEHVEAPWVSYPDWRACFCDRLVTLERLSAFLPHYKAALAAEDARSFVISVSESWSTDPGWQCSCGAMFEKDSDALGHIQKVEGVKPAPGRISVVPGLGRALKVIAIYEEFLKEI